MVEKKDKLDGWLILLIATVFHLNMVTMREAPYHCQYSQRGSHGLPWHSHRVTHDQTQMQYSHHHYPNYTYCQGTY